MNEERKWQAVMGREAAFDGAFVFAVRSTGIYCRPSCPARRPRRDRVVFFDNPDAAEAAGFRACRRCGPRATPPQVEAVERICERIGANLDTPVPLAELGTTAGMTGPSVQKLFRRELGVSPREYADAKRLESLKARLRNGEPVAAAVYDSGYGSSSRVYERTDRLGLTPASYRRGGPGIEIRYTVVPCDLGLMLLAATERGVCAVQLGASEAALESGLQLEFRHAALTRDDAGLREWAETAVQAAGGSAAPSLPLDIRATAFQARIWRALREIPRGETRSYRELAEAVGMPGAARAVARACATNPAAVLIPCHRVVGSDGALRGYRWGIERKRKLLEREQGSETSHWP